MADTSARAAPPPDRFRVSLAQLDPTVGALEENAERIAAAWARAQDAGADLAATPEMALLGYQPQDLVLRPSVVAACEDAVAALAKRFAGGPAALIGAPARAADGGVSNAYWLVDGGEIRAILRKRELPNYGVFDERRLYVAADVQGPVSVRGVRVGAPICEDAWLPEVAEAQAESGAEILIVPNGSPYARGKFEGPRMQAMLARVVETGLPLAYVNLAGAQDDQVFDGGSFALDRRGALRALAPFFSEADLLVDFVRDEAGWTVSDGPKASVPTEIEADYRAMVEGVRAYVRKNGFSEVLIGLSGGVDSALTAAIAADALGPEHVRCVMLPSKYTSDESLEDAAETARLVGARLDEISIAGPVEAMEAALAPAFDGLAPDVTEENIQSRIRGNLLMALSNKTGALLLTTGNKSEVAVGYATLYGDMSGAYNPLKDLYKMEVFAACRWRNDHHAPGLLGRAGRVIPERVIDKPPSAELRPDQKDEDSLPPYEDLDRMLFGLIEEDLAVSEVAERNGFDPVEVARVERLIALSEYKRHQAAPGPKLSTRAFWLERRYPLTNRWRSRL